MTQLKYLSFKDWLDVYLGTYTPTVANPTWYDLINNEPILKNIWFPKYEQYKKEFIQYGITVPPVPPHTFSVKKALRIINA